MDGWGFSSRPAVIFLAPPRAVMHEFRMREFRISVAQGKRIRAELRRGFAAQRAAREPLPPPITLKELRRSLHVTQDELGLRLGVKQARISKLERHPDPPVSALRAQLEALGGSLHLVARFPGRKLLIVLP